MTNTTALLDLKEFVSFVFMIPLFMAPITPPVKPMLATSRALVEYSRSITRRSVFGQC